MFRRTHRRVSWWTAARSSRLPHLVMVVLGLSLLAVAVFAAISASRQAAVRDLDHALTSEASANADALSEYFQRAQSIDLLMAHESVFQQFEPGPTRTQLETLTNSIEAGEALSYLEQLYPGRISQAALIDANGNELARVVQGRVATAGDLNSDEHLNPFFDPAMRLTEGRVYQAAPFVSADTHEWVVSNSTPLFTGRGKTWGLLHFEVSLESFRPTVVETGNNIQGFSVEIMDTKTGRILLEPNKPLTVEALGRPASSGLRGLAKSSEAIASGTVEGKRVVVARVSVGQDNANSWAVVVSSQASALGWTRSLGPAPISMALAAILLLAFSALNLRANRRELVRLSLTDELTGLPNRRLLIDRIDQSLLQARRRGTRCAVLLIDLDSFKEVNDTLGHDHGDQLLRDVADRLTKVLRESDTVGRLGGDEFAVLLPEVADADAALSLGGRFLSALHQAFNVDGVLLNVEASIGLAMSPDHGSDSVALLRAADVAMYEAKSRKGGVVLYDTALDVHAPTRLALLGDLRRALRDGELIMYYQPKVDLGTGEVRGVEALVRWQHPTRGLVPPDEFIPIAEGTGLIIPLTMSTVEMSIAQARAWLDAGRPLQVAVNLSPRCLEPGFPALVQGVLDAYALPPHLLRMEITESTLMADPDRALSVLTALQESGVSLSIDDFGTGYASMTYLKRLPIDELKIDRSFVLDMLVDSSDAVLVHSSIDLGHNLGLAVVAEGVEDQATLDILQEMGCDAAQGYHLAHPMAVSALNAWLDVRSTTAEAKSGMISG